MLQTILTLYIESLLIAAFVVVFLSACWFVRRALGRKDKSLEARHQFIYDLVLINVMTIPILSFGVLGILLVFKV